MSRADWLASSSASGGSVAVQWVDRAHTIDGRDTGHGLGGTRWCEEDIEGRGRANEGVDGGGEDQRMRLRAIEGEWKRRACVCQPLLSFAK